MSLRVQKNCSLAPHTTLKVGGEAAVFLVVTTKQELVEAIEYARTASLPIALLGSGSNVLVVDSGFPGCVIKMDIRGRVVEDHGETVELSVGAGEMLDDVIAYSVENNLWGIENLSHIPGTVGATPIQNVGAYGVEVKDVITRVTAFDTSTNQFEVLNNDACAFGYRDSLFKKEWGKKYIITEVTFLLSKKSNPKLTYTDLQKHFATEISVTQQKIRDAVIGIRSQKFPNWHEVGTAGSFFKNPIITSEKYTALLSEYPELPGYMQGDGTVKISLGFVLDKILNLRGYAEGNVRLYEHQALVLVADTGATAKKIQLFAEKIIEQVKNKIGVTVEMEVTSL